MRSRLSRPVTVRKLIECGYDWVLADTWVAALDGRAREVALAATEVRPLAKGDDFSGPGDLPDGVHVLLSGRVANDLRPDDPAREEYGPGRTFGVCGLVGGFEQGASRLRAVRYVATRPGHTLFLPAAAFRDLWSGTPAFRAEATRQAEVEARFPELAAVLGRNTFLRPLAFDDFEALLIGADVSRYPAGAWVTRAGEASSHVYVVLQGAVTVFASPDEADRRELPSRAFTEGDLFGHEAMLLEGNCDPDARALGQGAEVLRIEAEAFRSVVGRNPLVLRRLLQDLARAGYGAVARRRPLPGVRVVFVGSRDWQPADRALAHAFGWALQQPDTVPGDGESGLAVRLVDLRDGRLDAAAVREAEAPGTVVLACGPFDAPGAREAFAEADAVVEVRWPDERPVDLDARRKQRRFQAIRLRGDDPIPFRTARKSIRVPPDPAGADAFERDGVPPWVREPAGPTAEAGRRLARLVRGRSIGVALGGGGALGYAHVGLLRALHARDIPIDCVAGVSFGSVVGTMYAGGGLAGVDRLLSDRAELEDRIGRCPTGTRPLGRFVEHRTGGLRMGQTVIPFYPLGLNLVTGREFVLPDGTLGEAMESASSFPGAYPAFEAGLNRIADGGMVSNVPASVLWDAGVDFVLSSNIITSDPAGVAMKWPDLMMLMTPVLREVPGLRWLMERPLTQDLVAGLIDRLAPYLGGRLNDAVASVHLLLSQNGRDRSMMADCLFNFEMGGVEIYSFADAERIVDSGRVQAERLLDEVLAAYRDDPSAWF